MCVRVWIVCVSPLSCFSMHSGVCLMPAGLFASHRLHHIAFTHALCLLTRCPPLLRCKVLVAQLSDFVALYDLETEHLRLMERQQDRAAPRGSRSRGRGVAQAKFEAFLETAE